MSEATVKILVVDDERAIRRFLNVSLTAHGYLVYEASTGADALTALVNCPPDVLILDLGLPDMDGVDVIQRLRQWTQLPILILSVREHEHDKITALDAGADDYLTKPFSVGELMARLRVALRRLQRPEVESVVSVQGLTIDLARRIVCVAGQEVQLTPTEYDLLRVLGVHAGKVLTHRYLLQQVWGFEYADDLHILRVNISNLRRKIEPDSARPRYILTEPGVGYRFRGE